MFGLLLGSALVVGQSGGEVAGSAKWHPLKDQSGWVGLWVDGKYAGRLDPFDGVWEGPGRPQVNIREWAFKVNPPKRGSGQVGDLPAAATKAPGRPAIREDGDDKPAPVPKDGKAKRPALAGDDGCECGDGCTCNPCRCAEKGKKNTAPPTPPDLSPEIFADNRDNGPAIPKGGVQWDRVKTDGERFSIGGQDATRAEAMSAIEAAGKVPDDAGLVRLLVIGSDAARKPVVTDLKTSPEFAGLRDAVIVQDRAPSHWWISGRGFAEPKGDSPVIYAMKPDGTVLWRQDSYEGGAPALAKALRDKVPGYDPAKDPQPKVDPLPGPADGSPLKQLAWLAVPVVAGGAYLLRRRV
jgi:hypothetical protein